MRYLSTFIAATLIVNLTFIAPIYAGGGCANLGFVRHRNVVAVKALNVNHGVYNGFGHNNFVVADDHFPFYQVGYAERLNAAAAAGARQALKERDDARLARIEALLYQYAAQGGADLKLDTPLPANGDSALRRNCGTSSCHGEASNSPKGGIYFDSNTPIDCNNVLKFQKMLSGEFDSEVTIPAQMKDVVENLRNDGEERGAVMYELLKQSK